MARKKKKGNWFTNLWTKKKGRGKNAKPLIPTTVKVFATIIFLTILFAGGAIGFIYMDRFVQKASAMATPDGSLKLIDPPVWLEQPWRDEIVKAAGGARFPLTRSTAKAIALRLSTLPWLDNIEVQTTPEYITIKADYRRPVGLVKVSKNHQYYLDIDLVVMDYLPVTTLPVIEITGISSVRSIPSPGNVWAAEDAQAAVDLLELLYRTDLNLLQKEMLDKPLLDEIKSIDVSNYAERKSRSKPHIVLNVVDGTEVNWGAAWGKETQYMEADENEKRNKLYQHFMDHNDSLQGSAKYIELRYPEDGIPRPR